MKKTAYISVLHIAYMDVGKASRHRGGKFRCLFPRRYLATFRKLASGQSAHAVLAKAGIAEPDGRDESSGFPSPFLHRRGSRWVTFFPKRRGYILRFIRPRSYSVNLRV